MIIVLHAFFTIVTPYLVDNSLTISSMIAFLQDPMGINSVKMNCATIYVSQGSIFCESLGRTVVIMGLILTVGIILFIGAYLDNQRVRVPLICKLVRKYELGSIIICEHEIKRYIEKRKTRM